MTSHPIVLFDGVCNYCNSMVNFAIKHDPQGKLRFAPLQSPIGESLRKQYGIPASIDSVILIDDGKTYAFSDAALRIARNLNWPAKMLNILLVVPKFVRQPIYKWVARNRYKWFGKKETCMIPSPAIRSRFLENL